MMSARSAALAKLLSKFDEGDDEMLAKHAPKAVSVDVVKAEPEAMGGDKAGLDPEMLMKLLEALKGHDGMGEEPAGMFEGGEVDHDMVNDLATARQDQRSPEMEGPVHLAKGGEVPKGMGNHTCRGCGRDSASCVCDKMSDGGEVIADEGTHSAQMKRREEQRKLDEAQNASNDMDELAGEVKHEPKAKVARYAEGGMIQDDSTYGAQMKRRDDQREMDKDENAADDMAELGGEYKRAPKAKVATRKSRYWKG